MTWAKIISYFILAVPAVTHIITHLKPYSIKNIQNPFLFYQVPADTDMWVALKAIATTKGLSVLESRDDEVESVVCWPPAVSVVSQGHEVGPGDDEPVTAHTQRLRVTRDVGLQRFWDKAKLMRTKCGWSERGLSGAICSNPRVISLGAVNDWYHF